MKLSGIEWDLPVAQQKAMLTQAVLQTIHRTVKLTLRLLICRLGRAEAGLVHSIVDLTREAGIE